MKKLIIYFLFVLFVWGCSKEDNQTNTINDDEPIGVTDDDQVSDTNQDTEVEDGLIVSENAINTTEFQLKVDTLSTNITKIDLSGLSVSDSVKVGNILMDNEIGFLLKVIEKNESEIIVENASLDEYFTGGNIEFRNGENNKASFKKEQVDLSFNFNKELYNNGTASISFNGGVEFIPNITGNIDFDNNVFRFDISDTPLNLNGSLNLTLAGQTTLEEVLELGSVESIPVLVGPLLISYRASFSDKITVTASGSLSEDINASAKFNVNAFLEYNQNFNSDFNFNNLENDINVSLDGKVSLNIRHEIIPRLEILFYRVAGPYMELKPYDVFNLDTTTSGLDELNWDFYGEKGIDFSLGISTRLFQDLSYDYTWPVQLPERFFEMPKEIKLLTSQNIEVNGGEELSEPIKVEAVNTYGLPIAGVLIYAEVLDGSGSLREDKVFTNENGVAEFYWRVGCEENQKIEFFARKGDSTILNEEKLGFSPSINSCAERQLTLIPVSPTQLTTIPNSTIPLQVRVVDSNNNPVPETEVSWDFVLREETNPSTGVSNELSRSTRTSFTDSEGIAIIDWEIGPWSSGGNPFTFFNSYYAEAYLTEPGQGSSRIQFCSYMAEVSLTFGCSACTGEGSVPVNGTINLTLGNYSYTWTISNSQPSTEVQGAFLSSPLTFPNQQSFDVTGAVSINLNRAAIINLTPTPSGFDRCITINYVGFGSFIEQTSDRFDSQGNWLPVNETFQVSAFKN